MEKETKMNGQTANAANQVMPEITASGDATSEKILFSETSVKELLAKQEMQDAIRLYVSVPDVVVVKKVRKAFKPEGAKIKTQKIEGMCGTSLENAATIELTLVGMELEPKEAINKKYRIIDYTFGLAANMGAGKFNGYAAKGLKLMVTKLEEVKEGNK